MRVILILLLFCGISSAKEIDIYPNDKENGIQAPLANGNRALNTIGQCVWSSLQNAGRQIGEPKLYNLTKDPRCRGGANPSDVHRVLTALGVKFKQAYGNRKDAYALIEEGLSEGRPCLISYGTAHAINIVHYDPLANKVAVVNNHGDRFQTHYHTIKEFDKLFKGWVCIVYGPPEAEARLKEWREKTRKVYMDYYAPNNDKYETEKNF